MYATPTYTQPNPTHHLRPPHPVKNKKKPLRSVSSRQLCLSSLYCICLRQMASRSPAPGPNMSLATESPTPKKETIQRSRTPVPVVRVVSNLKTRRPNFPGMHIQNARAVVSSPSCLHHRPILPEPAIDHNAADAVRSTQLPATEEEKRTLHSPQRLSFGLASTFNRLRLSTPLPLPASPLAPTLGMRLGPESFLACAVPMPRPIDLTFFACGPSSSSCTGWKFSRSSPAASGPASERLRFLFGTPCGMAGRFSKAVRGVATPLGRTWRMVGGLARPEVGGPKVMVWAARKVKSPGVDACCCWWGFARLGTRGAVVEREGYAMGSAA